jgi:hypothetical protein
MKSSKKAGRKRKIVKELDELIENFTKPADKVVDSSCYEQGSPKKRAKVVCNSHSTATCSSTSMMKVSAETELAAYPNAKTQDEIRKQETGLSVRYNLNFEQFEEMLLIIQIAQHVPVAFKQTRQEMALLIMESLCPRSKEQVVDLLKEADSLPSDSSLRILAGKPPEELLWKVTMKSGIPVNRFFVPPVTECINCMSTLQMHHDIVNVVAFTTSGPIPAQKISLRCRHCNIIYHYDTYGDGSMGYRYYESAQSFIVASNVTFVEKDLCEQWIAAAHHTWMSFEGAAEVYNETMRETGNYNYLNLTQYWASMFGKETGIVREITP